MQINWNTNIKEALDRTEFMAISTVAEDESWVCPVQFSYDEKLNLYFKSMPNSRHIQEIKINPKVSIAIFSTDRLPSGDVIGIQLEGTATILTSRDNVEIAAKYHYRRSKPGTDYMTRIDEHLGSDALWNFAKVTPTEVWYFNSGLFDEEAQGRQKVPLGSLKIEL
ncbi:MAG: pyridoxamine 5'-phosphate oxidase family protein [Patescibacteria group bacterium]